jgi:DNA-binding MarR family transcriptional regulator
VSAIQSGAGLAANTAGPAVHPAGSAAADTAGSAAVHTAEPAVNTWRVIAASHAAACAALEHELGRRHGLGVSEFEVLDRLAEAGDRKFRAQELADAVHLSQSALSRLIDRLVKHGLVERCLCDLDRRGIFVTLTETGRQRHAEAVPTHREVLAGVLPAGLMASCAGALEDHARPAAG